jgi:FAD:protein FMN transferase
MQASAPSPPHLVSILRLSLGLIVAGVLVGAVARAPAGAARVRRARYLMGTVLEIDAQGRERSAVEAAVSAAFAAVERVEERLSNWRADSEISRANREAAALPVRLSRGTFESLAVAFRVARETAGAFDPTVGSVTEALGLMGRPADAARARRAWTSVGWQRAFLDPSRRAISLEPGAAIDSGGFGKGEALDRALRVLLERGVSAARLNFGGQISLLGCATVEGRRASYGRVAVAAPDSSGREVLAFQACDGSVSTSGDAEKPGHILDPRRRRAASFHGSVTVVASTGIEADALSTALFVMGPEEGVPFADRRGISAIYVSPSPPGYRSWRSRSFPPRISSLF